MRSTREKTRNRGKLSRAAFGLLSSVALAGCVSSAVTDISATTPLAAPDPRLAVAQTKADGETVPELQFNDKASLASTGGDVVATTDTAAAATLQGDAQAASAPPAPQQVALNAMQGSIYATQPASPAEMQAAITKGVTVPAFVPVPNVNPAAASLYGSQAVQPETATAAPAPSKAAEKGGRVVQKNTQVAGLFSAGPVVTAAPFDNNRFDPKQQSEENPLMQDSGGRPVAKLNAFFPDRPVAADDEEDEDEGADDQPEGLARLISAPGLARVAPNGIWIQTPYVETDCFKPNLVALLHKVEKHFGKPPVVTSGFRSANYNRKAGGASHSLHTTCSAADIQVRGVSKWELADYLRSMPDRGGVGTYCYTNSVHIDTGSERDWNWRCRRKKKK